jgi:hypothetical protein
MDIDRTRIELNCPGTPDNYIVIVPTAAQAQYGVGNPENTGDCTLFLDALDEDGHLVDWSQLQLDPGQSRHWYYPPSGAAQIVVSCHNTCHGNGELEFDTPIS